jgi:phage tail tape-measure protein
MKSKVFIVAVMVLSLFVLGCEVTQKKTATGAVAGGVIGATAGGIIGHQSGHGIEGAAIGGLVGVLSGGLIGSQMEIADKKALESNPNYLTYPAIVDMAKKGIPDAVIISEIDRTQSVYQLNAEIITYLKDNGVGDKVIDYMLVTSQK